MAASSASVSSASRSLRMVLVEDDKETRSLLRRVLEEEGFSVLAAGSVAQGREALSRELPALAILDVRLPDGDGIALCRSLREEGALYPILILTSRTDVASRVEGLDAGADDYLCKPFAVAELRARLRSLIRRQRNAPEETIVTAGSLTIDIARRQVFREGVELPLTRRELEILERLLSARGHVVSRRTLLEDIWGEESEHTAASLEVLVGRLRRKLDPLGADDVVRTIRGVGYALGLTPQTSGDDAR